MDREEYETKECFAYFGRAVYMAQTVEKGIVNSILLSYKNITQHRYDELLAEKSRLTFGQLKREIIERSIFSSDIISKLEAFYEKRDWLAHNYWWDRSVEFYRDDLRHKIIEELDAISSGFEALELLIRENVELFFKDKGADLESLSIELANLGYTPETPEARKLTRNEVLISIMIYEPKVGSKIPVFELEDNSYWTLCDVGLTSFAFLDGNKDLIPFEEVKGIFPVLQFNPRPKVLEEWTYEIDLKKKGMYMKVWQADGLNKFLFKWAIKYR